MDSTNVFKNNTGAFVIRTAQNITKKLINGISVYAVCVIIE